MTSGYNIIDILNTTLDISINKIDKKNFNNLDKDYTDKIALFEQLKESYKKIQYKIISRNALSKSKSIEISARLHLLSECNKMAKSEDDLNYICYSIFEFFNLLDTGKLAEFINDI